MQDSISLEVVTPEREVVREKVAEVQLPGRNGYLGILPEHTPLLTQLGIGTLSYKKGAETRFVSGSAPLLAPSRRPQWHLHRTRESRLHGTSERTARSGACLL